MKTEKNDNKRSAKGPQEEGVVNPGHLLRKTPSFKEQHKEDQDLPGSHAENVGGTANEEDDFSAGMDLSRDDHSRPEDADGSRLTL